MITFSDKNRSNQTEVMDNIDFQGSEMNFVLDDIKKINKWLGGNKITMTGMGKLLKTQPKDKIITILDLGCGDGELLRKCAEYGKKHNFTFNLIGIDFNKHILDCAKTKSKNYSNIKYEKIDVLLEEELIPKCDIALCTLFLHHFSNEKIEHLLKKLFENSNLGLIINDLHRNKIAFILFKIISKFFLKTKTAALDGLVSIAKGFKRKEIEFFSTKIPHQQNFISWRWAFRYQWIIKK